MAIPYQLQGDKHATSLGCLVVAARLSNTEHIIMTRTKNYSRACALYKSLTKRAMGPVHSYGLHAKGILVRRSGLLVRAHREVDEQVARGLVLVEAHRLQLVPVVPVAHDRAVDRAAAHQAARAQLEHLLQGSGA